MKSLPYLILCFAPLAMAGGGQSAQPVPGKVMLVYFWAAWCAPCRPLSPALELMAATDGDIALRKINIDESEAEAQDAKITSIPVVMVYNRGGDLVGTVVGANLDKIKSYVTKAKSG